MNNTLKINKLLQYLEVEPVTEVEMCFTRIVNRREITLILREDEVEAFPSNNPLLVIHIGYDEIDKINPYLCPSIEVLHDYIVIDGVTEVGHLDFNIRTSLCFKGDVILMIRPIIFGGAGVQSETSLKRVV